MINSSTSLLPYTPKAVRGISFPGFIRINRAQLAKLYASSPSFRFNGFIVGNNVNTFHFFGGWHLACTLENKTNEEITDALNGFESYLDAELGSGAAIFLKKRSLRAERNAVYNNDSH